jgi:hypothetical protein
MYARGEERARAKRERDEEPVNESALSLNQSSYGIEDLDAMFAEAPAGDADELFLGLAVPAEVDPSIMTPHYLLVEGISKLKQMAQILTLHFHVQNGETMEELYHADSRVFNELPTPMFHT